MSRFLDFRYAIRAARLELLNRGDNVDAGRWQGVPTAGKPDLMTREVLNFTMEVPIPPRKPGECAMEQPLFMLRDEIRPNLPWADEHFDERVSGNPTNPGESYLNWPWWRGQYDVTASTQGDDESKDDFRFSHTYQERFWPKHAGEGDSGPHRTYEGRDNWGIRYRYGDLLDVLALLDQDPYTRQAYLPIFFPEDTGAVHGGRIPCSLGYHFMLRAGKLHCWYDIRSCDYVRHFRDDIYLAARLQLWVLEQMVELELRGDKPQVWVDVDPGNLYMSIHSLHFHEGDRHHVLAERP